MNPGGRCHGVDHENPLSVKMLQSVPVCIFHHVNGNAGDYLTVSTDKFKSMMSMLKREGYTTLSSEEFRRYKLGLGQVPRKSLLLTFDDAWLDVYVYAFPILREYDFKFTIFVVSDWVSLASRQPRSSDPVSFPSHRVAESFVDTPRVSEVLCNWDDLRLMLQSGLCSIENHTASHGRRGDVRRDVAEGRQAIRNALGVPANQLCWPYGKHSREDLRIARELGIDITYLVRRGVNLPRYFTMRIKRFNVEDCKASWLKRQLDIFSRPLYGYLYSRAKLDRWKRRWFGPPEGCSS